MINSKIVKKTIIDVYRELPIIFIISILTFILLLLAFTFEVKTHNGNIISFSIINHNINKEDFYYFKNGLTSVIQLLGFVFIFILILQSSHLFADTFNNPLLGIILTKNISFSKLLTSKFIGQLFAVLILLLCGGFGTSIVIFWKVKNVFYFEPIILSILIFYEFLILFSFITFLSALIKKASSVMFIAIFFFIAVNALFGLLQFQNSQFFIFRYILPYTKNIHAQIINLFDSFQLNYASLSINLVQIFIYLTLSYYFFSKKEL